MYVLDARILNVLKSRAAWQKGKVYMGMSELQNLVSCRFPQDGRPARRDIRAAIRRLTRIRCLSWAITTNEGIVYLA